MRNTKNLSQGFFKPKNPQKYEGDPTNIVFRSSWEFAVMKWCDLNPSVMAWQSEELVIPYYFPVDEKWHRYFVDFRVTLKNSSGNVITYLIEVKPYDQVQRPNPPKNRGRKTIARYEAECVEWIKNQEKWKAANLFAEKHGWQFKVLTEREIFPGKK